MVFLDEWLPDLDLDDEIEGDEAESETLEDRPAGEGADLEKAEDDDPCWDGYEAVGMKRKGGRKVPNCVPLGKTAYSIAGALYVPAIVGDRVLLIKAARRRISPGQMSLFDISSPRQGERKVVNGVTYVLNENSRWEREDDATPAPMSVLPILKDDETAPTAELEEPLVIAEEMTEESGISTLEPEIEVEIDAEIDAAESSDAAGLGGQLDTDAGDEPGIIDSAGDRGATGGVIAPRIVTSRADLTASADTDRIPGRLRPNLTEYQQQGAALALSAMDTQGGFLLADGTGVGKTRQLIAIAQAYADQGKKVLVVAPSQVIKQNWKKGTFAGSYAKDSAAMGVDIQLTRDGQELKAGQVFLSTYDSLSKLKDAVDKDTVLIFDEAHAFKNVDSARTKHGIQMMREAHSVCYATATPADKPEHIPYLFRSDIFKGNKKEDIYTWLGLKSREIPVSGGKTVKVWNIPNGRAAHVHHRMQGLFDDLTERGLMIQRGISMEGVNVEFSTVEIPPEANQMLDAIAKAYDYGENGGLEKAQMLMHQRRQLEPYKIAAAVEECRAELQKGNQVVLFVSRVSESTVTEKDPLIPMGDVGMIRASSWNEDGKPKVIATSEGTAGLLRQALEEAGISDIAELHGAADTKATAAMSEFQEGRARVIIATIESGGTGVNLDDIGGDRPRTMLLMTPPFSAVENIQAAGRVWRMTTRSYPTLRYLFTDTPVDEWNRSIIATKMATVGAAVKGAEVLNLPRDLSDDALEAFMDAQRRGDAPSGAAPRPPEPSTKTPPPGFRVNQYGGRAPDGTWVNPGEGFIRKEGGQWVTYARNQVDSRGQVNVAPKAETPSAPKTTISASARQAKAQSIIDGIRQSAARTGESPYTPEEMQALQDGLVRIESSDMGDRGGERNLVGWSGSTRADGVRLATKVQNGIPLTADEYTRAAELMRVHKRQFGSEPPEVKQPVSKGIKVEPTYWSKGDRTRVYLNKPGYGGGNYGFIDIGTDGTVYNSSDFKDDHPLIREISGLLGETVLRKSAQGEAKFMGTFFSLGGALYYPTLVNGELVLAKASRRPSPGQMSLFDIGGPRQGERKTINGTTYVLNQNSRWEREDDASPAPVSVLPILEDDSMADVPSVGEVKSDRSSPLTPMQKEEERIRNTAVDMARYQDRINNNPELRRMRAEHEKRVEQAYQEVMDNQAEWTTLEGEPVLRVKDSNYVAIPANGRKNSANFVVLDLRDRSDFVTQLSKKEVHGWLTKRYLNEKESGELQDVSIDSLESGPPAADVAMEDFESESDRLSIQEQMAEIPSSVLSNVQIQINSIKRWNGLVQRARETDSQFQGGGRYTWEATGGGKQPDFTTEYAKLDKFRELAAQKGYDAEGILQAMGLEEPLQLTSAERDDAESDRPPVELPKSKGHLGFLDGFEYFEVPGGDIARAKIDEPIAIDGYRFGRFESTPAGWQSSPIKKRLDELTPPPAKSAAPKPEPMVALALSDPAVQKAVNDVLDNVRLFDTDSKLQMLNPEVRGRVADKVIKVLQQNGHTSKKRTSKDWAIANKISEQALKQVSLERLNG